MTTTLILLGLLIGAGYWCYRQGKGSEALTNVRNDLSKLKKINESDEKHDLETDSILDELGGSGSNGPPSVLDGKQDRDR